MKQSIDEKLDELLDINNEAEEVVKETNRQLVPRDQNGRFTERKDEISVDVLILHCYTYRNQATTDFCFACILSKTVFIYFIPKHLII